MAHIFGNAVKETSTTTGTGNLTLLGAVSTFRTVASVCANNDTFYYRVAHQTLNEWEEGFTSFVSATPAIARTAANVTGGSAGAGVLVNFSAGTKDVLMVAFGHNIGGVITPTTTGNIDNWNPPNLQDISEIRWNGASSAVLRGLAGGFDGRRIRIVNATATQTFVIAHEQASSTAANRITGTQLGRGQHRALFPGHDGELVYNGANSRWEIDDYTAKRDLRTRYRRCLAQYPGTGTAPNALGIPHTSAGGTISHPTIASTNFATSQHRTRGASGTTAGTQTGTRGTNATCLRGSAAGVGGFHFRACWGKNANTSGGSELVGIAANSAPGNVDASAVLNQVAFQRNPTETEWRIGSNDGAGAATRTTLGLDFPCNSTTAVYEGHLWAAPNGSAVLWAIWRLDDLTLTPQCGSLTTDLPVTTTVLTNHVWACNRADAATIEIEWHVLELGLP